VAGAAVNAYLAAVRAPFLCEYHGLFTSIIHATVRFSWYTRRVPWDSGASPCRWACTESTRLTVLLPRLARSIHSGLTAKEKHQRNLSDRKLRSSMRDVLSALSDPEYNSSSIFFSRPSVSIMSGLAKKAKSEWSTDSRGSLFTRRHHEVTTPGLWLSPRRYALIT